MAVSITELVPGNELQIWMKLGLAIKPAIRKGVPYYKVPTRSGKTRAGDLTRFIGWVVRNDVEDELLSVQVSLFNSKGLPRRMEVPKVADLPYNFIQRARLFSAINFEPREQILGTKANKDIRRPGSLYPNTSLRPYRTVEEVTLEV